MMNSKITLKLQSQSKTKRVRELPQSFSALKAMAEAQIKEEREANQLNESFHSKSAGTFMSGTRDYSIRYVDGDQEVINVSDDEDLLTAYDVAEKELNGNLKLSLTFKQQPSLNQTFSNLEQLKPQSQEVLLPSGSQTERVFSNSKSLAAEEKKSEEVTAIPQIEATADALSKNALKKALKSAAKEALKLAKKVKQETKEKKEAKLKSKEKTSLAMKAQKLKVMDEFQVEMPLNIKDTIKNALSSLMGFQLKPATKPQEEVKVNATSVEEPLIQEVPYVINHNQNDEERTQSTLVDEEVKEEQIPQTQPSFMIDTSSKQNFRKHFTSDQRIPKGLIKGMQKFIKRGLDIEAKQAFENVKTIVDDFEPENPHVTHERCECDGCGAFPIVGTRYKCSVCKNFDFCSRCEEFVPHKHPFLKLVDPNNVPLAILVAFEDDEEESKEESQSHCSDNAMFGDQIWQNFQGNAQQWRDHAKAWADQLLGKYIQAKLVLTSKPEQVIKGNPKESVMFPIEFKNVGSCQIPQGSYIGLKNRNAQLTNFIVDDIPLNSQTKPGETLSAQVMIRFLKPNNNEISQKLVLCVFNSQDAPISDEFEIEVGFICWATNAELRQSSFYENAMEIESMNIGTFEKCLSALEQFGGNMEQAIDYLLNQV